MLDFYSCRYKNKLIISTVNMCSFHQIMSSFLNYENIINLKNNTWIQKIRIMHWSDSDKLVHLLDTLG